MNHVLPSRLISGTFVGIDHCSDQEAARFQQDIRRLGEAGWTRMVQDMHGIGIDTLIMHQSTCSRDGWGQGKAYYRSRRRPVFDWIKDDPYGALVAEATRLDMTIYYGIGDMYCPEPYRHTQAVIDDALSTADELLKLYGELPSFGGWYWTYEYSPSTLPGRDSLRQIVPALRAQHNCSIMLAPNADRAISPTLLQDIDVDIMAYQDTVSMACPDVFSRYLSADRHTSLHRLPMLYESLKLAHDAWQPADSASPGYWYYYDRPRGRTALWNDLEVWEMDHRHAIYPTEVSRIDAQLKLTAPHVEKQVIFQYPGLMCHPDHPVQVGGERAVTLYECYAEYRGQVLSGRIL